MTRLRRDTIALVTTALCVVGYLAVALTDVVTIRYLLVTLVSGYLIAWAVYGLLSTVSRAELITRLTLTTTSIIGCLVVAESPALLRVVDYRAILGSFESESPLSGAGRRADHELLWRHDPYYRYEEAYQGNLGQALCVPPDPSRQIAVQYDRNGFRNSRDLEQADIVVIGDSYIEGYMTAEPLLVTSLLGQLQGKIVANLGHSGYGPQQELVVLKRYGLPLRPQTVIWTFFEGNDFSDAEQYDKQRARASDPVWQDVWYRSLTRNALARTLRPAHRCTAPSSIEQFQAHFRDAHDNINPVFFAPSEVQPLSEDKVSQVVTYLAKAAMLCRERNIRFIVAFIPEKYRVYHNLSNVQLSSDALRSWQVAPLPEEMASRLNRLDLGIEYVDLTLPLRSASRKGIATYLPDDTHWTDAGNRVVAERLDQALRSFSSQKQRPLQTRRSS